MPFRHVPHLLLAMSLPPLAAAAPVPAVDAKAAVKHYFAKVDAGGAETAWLLAPPAKDVVAELAAVAKGDNESHRTRAIGLITYIGRQSKDKVARRAAVEALLAHEALPGLVKFSKADFPKDSEKTIEKLVRATDPHNDAILLAGILNVTSVTKDLKALAEPAPGRPPFLNPQWSANLALARLGDADAVKHCVAAIAAEPDVAQRVRHFPELVFIRQAAATESLTGYLSSDELLPSIKANLPGSPVWQYALNVLAENADGFPIKSEGGPTYTADQLAAARKWVTGRTELKWRD